MDHKLHKRNVTQYYLTDRDLMNCKFLLLIITILKRLFNLSQVGFSLVQRRWAAVDVNQVQLNKNMRDCSLQIANIDPERYKGHIYLEFEGGLAI